MQDLTDRLARLGDRPDSPATSGDDTVAGDLHRGRRALRHRSLQRGAIGIAGVAAAAAVVSVAIVGGSSHPSGHEAVASTHSQVTHPAARHDAIQLVAYHGAQPAGFTVKYVPSGYVLQGVSGSTLDITQPGDRSPLDTFSGKLTVGIEAVSESGGLGAYHGTPVTIDGEPGIVSTDRYGTTLVYEQGRGSNNLVTVQCWKNITLTQDQVVDFANGVTVTAQAQRQHG